MNFAETFKTIRAIKGISQAKLGKDLQVNERTVRRWEAGDIMPSGETLGSIADYFNTSVDRLLGRQADISQESIYTFVDSMDKQQLQQLSDYINQLLADKEA